MTTDTAARQRWLDKAKPPSHLAGRLATQSLLFALGEGTFMTGSAVFFTQVVGLTVAQVGLGLTIAGIAGFIAAYPMGRIVDRIGAKRCWSISSAGQAAMFAVWPFIDSFQGYLAMAVVMEVIGALGGTAHGAYTIDVLPPKERVKSRAYMYSALNVGFTLGSLARRDRAGLRVAHAAATRCRGSPPRCSWSTPSQRDPVARRPARPEDRRGTQGQDPRTGTDEQLRVAGRNVLQRHAVDQPGILNLVIPLWLVEKTDAPWVVLAFLFGTNTVMCIFLPLAAARGIKDNATALRAIRLSTVFFIVSCVITLSTHHSVGLWTVLLFFLGHVTLTGAELYLSAASWTFEAELMDPRRRGEYQGAAELSSTLGRVWAPALYTFLAMNWGSPAG